MFERETQKGFSPAFRLLKRTVRRLCGMVYLFGGFFFLVRFFRNCMGKRLTIVTYHRIADRDIRNIQMSLPYLFTSKKIFLRQLALLKRWYQIITFEELSAYLAANQPIPRNSLIITFDDGYADNYLTVYPILRYMRLSAIFFLPVGKIGCTGTDSLFWWDRAYCYIKQLHEQDNRGMLKELNQEIQTLFQKFYDNPSILFSHLNKESSEQVHALLNALSERLRINHEALVAENAVMNWEQVCAMNGNVHFGSHAYSHNNLLAMQRADQWFEIAESKRTIEQHTSRRTTVFCYPCGNLNDSLKHLVNEAEYEFAVTTTAGINDLKDRYALKRLNIWENTSLSLQGGFSPGYFAMKLSGF
ncbi:MAG: polysaccharide deacetylase family protein [Nitrospirota bacterium]